MIFRFGCRAKAAIVFNLLFLAVLMPARLLADIDTCGKASGVETKKVMIVTSFSSIQPWTRNILEGMEKYFADAKYPVSITLSELASMQNAGHGQAAESRKMVLQSVKNIKPDILIIVDLPAIELLRGNYDGELKDIPLVLCGLPEFEEFSAQTYPNSTAVLQTYDIPGNIALGMKIFPNTKEIAVITDSSVEGVGVDRHFREEMKDFKGAKLRFINGAEYSTEQMLAEAASMPEDSFIVFTNWRSARPELVISLDGVMRELDRRTNGAILAALDNENKHILGGIMARGYRNGRIAAELADKILRGAPAESLAPVKGGTEALFNWEYVKNLDIDGGVLPAGSQFFLRPAGIWKSHSEAIVFSFGALLALALAVILLFYFRNKALRKTRAMCERLPLRITIFKDGEIVDFYSRYGDVRYKSRADLSDETCAMTDDALEKLTEAGVGVTCYYSEGSMRRKVLYEKLPDNVFGKNAAMAVSVDVSDLYDARRKHEAVAEHLRLMVDSIWDAVIATDAEGRITLFNRVAETLTGRSGADVLGGKISDVVCLTSSRDGSPVNAPLEAAMKEGRFMEGAVHADIVSKDGTRRHIASSAAPIKDSEGALVGGLLVIKDVTDDFQKRAEIFAKNALLENAVEIGNMAYFVCDMDIRSNVCSKGDPFRDRYWHSRNGKIASIEEWVIADDAPEFLSQWRKMKNGESDMMDVEYRSDYSGRRKYFHMRVFCKRAKNQGESILYGVVQDLTDFRQKEFELTDAKILFENIINDLPNYIFVKDVEDGFRYTMRNKFWLEKSGFYAEHPENADDLSIFGPERGAEYRCEDEALAAGAEPVERLEQFRKPDGSMAYVKSYKKLITRSNGRRVIAGVMTDITDILSMRDEIEEKNYLLTMIIDSLPCFFWIKDGPVYIMANRAIHEACGMPEGSIIGKTDVEFCSKADAEKFRLQDDEVVESGGVCHFSITFSDARGGTLNLKTIKVPLEAKDGRRLILGMSFDVTELSQAQSKMKSYVEQERIINKCLELALSNERGVNVEDEILKIIGEQLGAERCYIFDLDYEHGTSNNTNEWCAGGVEAQKTNLQGVPIEDMSDWVEFFQKDRIIKTDNLAADPSPAFNKLRGMLLAQDIKTLLVAGIWTGGKLWGFVGIDFVKTMHRFTNVDENMLASTAKIFELYLDRKNSLEILEQNEAEKSMIIESVGIPILLFDGEGKLVRVNSTAARIADKTPEQVISEPCWQNFCDGKLKGAACPVRRCIVSGEPHTIEFRHRDRDYMTSVHPVKNKAGRVVNVIETSIDMTEYNADKRKLKEAMEIAKAADKAKSTFLATMSHEIRTPLNAIIGLSELLSNEAGLRADMAENISSINVSGRALLSIINDVLELSKIEADKLEITLEWTDLGMVLDEVKRMFGAQAAQRGIEFRVAVPAEMPEFYFCSARFRQILMNIVGNAMKFTAKGGVFADFEILPCETPDACDIRLRVRDTGCGIPKEDLKKVFAPFEQSTGRRGTAVREGTGLGLSIVSRLVEKLNGTISLESELGVGSAFTVVFHSVKTKGVVKASRDGLTPLRHSDWSGLVWVLDDVELNCKVLSMMLQRLGIKSEYMVSAQTLLDRVKAGERPDLVMTDMWMPEMNGEDFTRKLLELPGGAGIPVVAVTADTEAKESFALDIFAGTLLKPVTIAKLEELLGELSGDSPQRNK